MPETWDGRETCWITGGALNLCCNCLGCQRYRAPLYDAHHGPGRGGATCVTCGHYLAPFRRDENDKDTCADHARFCVCPKEVA